MASEFSASDEEDRDERQGDGVWSVLETEGLREGLSLSVVEEEKDRLKEGWKGIILTQKGGLKGGGGGEGPNCDPTTHLPLHLPWLPQLGRFGR